MARTKLGLRSSGPAVRGTQTAGFGSTGELTSSCVERCSPAAPLPVRDRPRVARALAQRAPRTRIDASRWRGAIPLRLSSEAATEAFAARRGHGAPVTLLSAARGRQGARPDDRSDLARRPGVLDRAKPAGRARAALERLALASRYGLSPLTCGRGWLLVMPSSSSRSAISLERVEVPRSAWTVTRPDTLRWARCPSSTTRWARCRGVTFLPSAIRAAPEIAVSVLCVRSGRRSPGRTHPPRGRPRRRGWRG